MPPARPKPQDAAAARRRGHAAHRARRRRRSAHAGLAALCPAARAAHRGTGCCRPARLGRAGSRDGRRGSARGGCGTPPAGPARRPSVQMNGVTRAPASAPREARQAFPRANRGVQSQRPAQCHAALKVHGSTCTTLTSAQDSGKCTHFSIWYIVDYGTSHHHQDPPRFI